MIRQCAVLVHMHAVVLVCAAAPTPWLDLQMNAQLRVFMQRSLRCVAYSQHRGDLFSTSQDNLCCRAQSTDAVMEI